MHGMGPLLPISEVAPLAVAVEAVFDELFALELQEKMKFVSGCVHPPSRAVG
jgi:hypothetical protein